MPISGGWQTYSYQDPDYTESAAPPVVNTWYPSTTLVNAKIYNILCAVEDTNETIEVQIVVDGHTIPAAALAATHSTEYACKIQNYVLTNTQAVVIEAAHTDISELKGYLCSGKSIVVSIRQTTDTGDGILKLLIEWSQLTNA